MTDPHAPDVVVTEADQTASERGPIAWMYVYNVRYEYKLECTKRQPPVVTLSLARWTEKQRTHWIETPLFATQSAMQLRIEELEAALADKKDADLDRHIFAWFNDLDCDEMRRCLETYDARQKRANIGGSNDG